jgi:hypothetical protein
LNCLPGRWPRSHSSATAWRTRDWNLPASNGIGGSVTGRRSCSHMRAILVPELSTEGGQLDLIDTTPGSPRRWWSTCPRSWPGSTSARKAMGGLSSWIRERWWMGEVQTAAG